MTDSLPSALSWVDFMQRQILFMDTLFQRSQTYLADEEIEQPPILQFQTELLADGRKLPKPVNYKLERIIPESRHQIDESKRPVIIFDPRAAQSSGMAGMKQESQIDRALSCGHPTYYVSFFRHPEDAQTIKDVCLTCTDFIKQIKELHKDAPPPILIGNCQAGWQLALINALTPELNCPLILAASPLSYWAGTHGQNPMRYTSGMVGGSWVASMASDLGGGLFDSSYLLDGFEKNSPSIAYWDRPYSLFKNIDQGTKRYLDFERWWNSPIFFRAEEIQFIVERLFIKNELVKGTIEFGGKRADLSSIKAPIYILCGPHDVITPPAQALGWLLDLYKTDEELKASGQTVIYHMDSDAGHLGLITSKRVVRDIYQKLFDNMPELEPGLYEAVGEREAQSFSYEARGLDDIRKHCPYDYHDEQRFTQVAATSDQLQQAYEANLKPLMQLIGTNPYLVEMLRNAHPIRAKLLATSSYNPIMPFIALWAEGVRAARVETKPNALSQNAEKFWSDTITESIDTLNKQKDLMVDALFSTFYGIPWLK